MEFAGVDARVAKARTQLLQSRLVADREMDDRRMAVGRSTVEIGVLDAGVSGLHGLLRDGDIAARDGVEVALGKDLRFAHDGSRKKEETLKETGRLCRIRTRDPGG